MGTKKRKSTESSKNVEEEAETGEKPMKMNRNDVKGSVKDRKPKFAKAVGQKPFAEKKAEAGFDNETKVKKGLSKSFKRKDQFNSKPNNFKRKSGADDKPLEKTDWKELKQKKKDLRTERRKTKMTENVFAVSKDAKTIAMNIARKTAKDTERDTLCKRLHSILHNGQYANIVLSHDLSRVIQVLVKHANNDIRSEIAEELMPLMSQMMQSKYAHHCVKALLKHGSESIKKKIAESVFGNVITFASHTITAPVLDHIYRDIATQKQKEYMQQEFYGDMYKNSKDDNVHKLNDAYKDSPEMKGAILTATKANIQRILEKNLHDGEVLHSVLRDFLEECGQEDRIELIGTLSPLVVPLSNSLPGVQAACLCVWQGTNKDKKTILKVVKEHAVPLSTHKSGYRLLLSIFDSVDDTVLVKKAIISALLKCVKDIVNDHWGRMTIQWLVAPGDTTFFHPQLVKNFKEEAAKGNSKKDVELRVTELKEAVVPTLCEEIVNDTEFWLTDAARALTLAAILKAATAEQSKGPLESLSSHITKVNWVVQEEKKETNGIEHAGMHFCLKKIAQNDAEISKSNGFTFGKAISEALSDETVTTWMGTNRGCFLLADLLKFNSDKVNKALLKKLQPHAKLLDKQNNAGAKLLKEKLNV